MEPKDKELWVVAFHGEKTVVQVIRSGASVHVYECGDEQGWDAARKDIGLSWVRKIRL